jgi:hypothetical protein
MQSTGMNTRKLLNTTAVVSLAAVVLLATSGVASACPSCQAALAGDPEHGDLARGIYYSILFMMSMPFAIIGSFGFLAYRAVKREQRRIADEQAMSDDDSPRG